MSKATETLVEDLKRQAIELAATTQKDFETFVAPIVRDLDLILMEPDVDRRDQLRHALTAQLKGGVPELVRVTGSRRASEYLAGLAVSGSNLLINLVSAGAVKLVEGGAL